MLSRLFRITQKRMYSSFSEKITISETLSILNDKISGISQMNDV